MTTKRRQQALARGGSGVTLALGQKEVHGQVGVMACAPLAPWTYFYLGLSHYTELIHFCFL